MTKQFHSKHHYVPQSYLKRWENDDRKVLVYRTLVDHERVPVWKSYSTKAIAYQKHLYTQVLSGQESDDLEVWFDQNFEAPADEVIERATNDRRLSKADWAILIRFLAAQDVRTPSKMLDHLRRASSDLSNTLNDVLNDVKQKIENRDYEDLKIYDEPARNSQLLPLKVVTEVDDKTEMAVLRAQSFIGRSSWIFGIKHILENTVNELYKHKWSIVKPAKGYRWFTSDNPVVKLNYSSSREYDLRGGWGVKKGNIIFPIGPQHAMFVQIGDRPIPKGSRLTVTQTREIRGFLAENSHRMIFSKDVDNEVASIRKRVVDSAKLKLEKEYLEKWHQENSELEREYFANTKQS